MGTIVPVAKTLDWIVELDLRGRLLRDGVWVLERHSRQYHVLSYRMLRRLLQEELESVTHQKPGGFVSALWMSTRRGYLPQLIAACDRVIGASGRDERYLSLLGFDRLSVDIGGGPALERVLELTANAEVRRRLTETFR